MNVPDDDDLTELLESAEAAPPEPQPTPVAAKPAPAKAAPKPKPTYDDDDGDDFDTFLEASGLTLSDGEPIWRREWQNMPEFVQEKQEAYATITVRFRSQEDLEDFARRIDQQVNPQTKSIWHPYKSHWGGPSSNKRYVDEP